MTKKKASRIIEILALTYPGAECGLRFKNPFQLLIATILSAQSSDAGVNKVTPALWRKFPGPGELSGAKIPELEALFKPLGLFRSKAKNVRATARRIHEIHGGRVPPEMEALRACPGVGRKTARVVLGECFQQPGIVVDTHMGRVARRLGLSGEEDPEKLERDLDALVPLVERTRFSHHVIAHGRERCHARNPDCGGCPLIGQCLFYRRDAENIDGR